jgi:PAS domain S-box-containing protein
MKNDKDEGEELRRKAEEEIRKGRLPGSSGARDPRRRLHELQVHQIELELQNEELRETRAKAEQALAHYLDLYEFAPVPYLTVDLKGSIVQANLAAAEALKVARSRLVGRMLWDRVPREDRPGLQAFIAKTISEGGMQVFETGLRLENGEPRFFRISGSCKDEPEGKCLLALSDITEREQARKELQRAGEEKAMLMRELQHRVKNSLAVVHSLLGIGESQVEDPKARDILTLSRIRVIAIAHIYEQLYTSGEVLAVDLGQYFERLIVYIVRSYSEESSRIHLVKSFDKIDLDAHKSALAGLIFSELISNATKYAYPASGAGELRVSLLNRDGFTELRVADDGAGLPPGLDPETTTSMGFYLLRMLAEQMSATLEFASAPGEGVAVTLRIPR